MLQDWGVTPRGAGAALSKHGGVSWPFFFLKEYIPSKLARTQMWSIPLLSDCWWVFKYKKKGRTRVSLSPEVFHSAAIPLISGWWDKKPDLAYTDSLRHTWKNKSSIKSVRFGFLFQTLLLQEHKPDKNFPYSDNSPCRSVTSKFPLVFSYTQCWKVQHFWPASESLLRKFTSFPSLTEYFTNSPTSSSSTVA